MNTGQRIRTTSIDPHLADPAWSVGDEGTVDMAFEDGTLNVQFDNGMNDIVLPSELEII